MRQIQEAFEDQAAILAYIIAEANRPVAENFAINQDNCPKHPSFCEPSWVESDFKRGERYFVLTENQQPIACVAYEVPMMTDINTNRARKAYLNRLSVLPRHQNKGLGSQLVAYIIKQAQLDDLQFISIGVIGQYSQLQDWYEKLGFVKGDTKNFEHLPFAVTYMVYHLNRP